MQCNRLLPESARRASIHRKPETVALPRTHALARKHARRMNAQTRTRSHSHTCACARKRAHAHAPSHRTRHRARFTHTDVTAAPQIFVLFYWFISFFSVGPNPPCQADILKNKKKKGGVGPKAGTNPSVLADLSLFAVSYQPSCLLTKLRTLFPQRRALPAHIAWRCGLALGRLLSFVAGVRMPSIPPTCSPPRLTFFFFSLLSRISPFRLPPTFIFLFF